MVVHEVRTNSSIRHRDERLGFPSSYRSLIHAVHEGGKIFDLELGSIKYLGSLRICDGGCIGCDDVQSHSMAAALQSVVR